MNLPMHYEFTEQDCDRAWEIWARMMSDEDVPQAEEEFFWLLHGVEAIKDQIGRWPTYGEYLAVREQEEKQQ